MFMAGHDRDGVREECERTFRDVNSTGDVSFGASQESSNRWESPSQN